MAPRFRYPTGARPLLIEETARRKRIETRIVAMLESAGFAEVTLPIIDYSEPYAEVTGAAAAKQSYRFVDREGELVAVRSDFTPMIARALAPAISDAVLPLQVFYRGDVVRCEASRLGANREMFQIGAEIIGDATTTADVNVLTVAADVARAFGITPLVIYSDASIVNALVAEYGEEMRTALVTKRLPERYPPLVERLIAGDATLDDLGDLPAASRLREIATALHDDTTFVLHLDDAEESASYYTGLRFRLYDAATRARIAQGGRYDELYARFGTAAPAVGLTFTIDDLD
jgi:ATP phosphoribosyltransferase regulatory subunit